MFDAFQRIQEEDWGLFVVNKAPLILDSSSALDGFQRILDTCSATGKNRVLMDARTTVVTPTNLTLYELGQRLTQSGIQCLRIALARPSFTDTGAKQFTENVFFNRGAALQHFDDMESAKTWLLQSV